MYLFFGFLNYHHLKIFNNLYNFKTDIKIFYICIIFSSFFPYFMSGILIIDFNDFVFSSRFLLNFIENNKLLKINSIMCMERLNWQHID